jgi:hypothetical protein
MSKIKAITYQLQAHKQALFWMFAALVVTLFGLYIYFINATVFNVVTREKLETHIADLNTHVSEIEIENIALKNSITLDRATALGFTESRDTIFVSRTSRNLSYNNR